MLALAIAALSARPATAVAGGTSGFYDPEAIAAQSTVFTDVSTAMMPSFEAAEQAASRLASALREWEEGLDLLGARASAEERQAYETTRQTFHRELEVLRRYTDTQLVGFDVAFRGALDRALAGRDLVACTPQQGGLRMMPGGRGEAKSCPGPDRTGEIVSRIDADAALRASARTFAAATWPTMDAASLGAPPPAAPSSTASPPAAGGVIDIGRLFRLNASHGLAAIEAADAEARLPFEAAIEAGADKAELASLRDQAAKVSEQTAARRAALAAPVLAQVDKLNLKRAKRGEPVLSWCARPEDLGGCAPAASTAALDVVLGDPKSLKLLDAADASTPR
jgi:hypothetical protein